MYDVKLIGSEIRFTDKLENAEIRIPEENYIDFIKIDEPSKLQYPEDFIKAFENPINSRMLNEIAIGCKRVSIIVSDSTRGIPTAKVLPFVIKELEKGGIELNQITIVVALGVHRFATDDEIEEIVGSEYVNKIKIINHDAYDKEKLIDIGTTSFGTPIEVNRNVYDSDLRIIIGKVEPHEFAGFSGGRKSVLPGVSSEKTIEINHRPEMLLHKNARPGVMEKNPINEEMEEAAKMLGIHFAVNIVQDSNAEIIGIFCGDLFESHYRAIDYMKSFCEVSIKDKADIVITTPGEPLNIDLYQSIKPLIALAPIMNDNGVIFLYSNCAEGVNSIDMVRAFEGAKSLDEVISFLIKNYKIQMDHSLLLSKIMQQNIKVVFYSPNVDKEITEKLFMVHAISPQDGLNKSFEIAAKENPRVLIFPQPQRTLPVIGYENLINALLE